MAIERRCIDHQDLALDDELQCPRGHRSVRIKRERIRTHSATRTRTVMRVTMTDSWFVVNSLTGDVLALSEGDSTETFGATLEIERLAGRDVEGLTPDLAGQYE